MTTPSGLDRPWRAFREQVERHVEVTSTMQLARERAAEGAAEGTTVVAEVQTAGRGRRGRQWQSPRGAGLLFTTLLRPQVESSEASGLGLVAGVALLEVLHGLGGTGVRLKWPNDLLVGERKLAGILLEAEALAGPEPVVLVGVGLNLAAQKTLQLPEDIMARYIGLSELVDPIPHAKQLLSLLLDNLQLCYRQWHADGLAPFVARWQAWDALSGRSVRAEHQQGIIEGVARGIDEQGALRIEVEGEIRRVQSGEVQLI